MNRTARESWADLNESLNAEELAAALQKADSGDWSDADLDIENYNYCVQDDQPLLTRRDWYLGIEDAIEFLLS